MIRKSIAEGFSYRTAILNLMIFELMDACEGASWREPFVIKLTLIHTMVSAVGLHYAACDAHLGLYGDHLSGAPRCKLPV